MKKFCYMLLVVFITGTASAQTETQIAKTIKGKVVNEATNEPVAYTNVGIENTFYGTASDDKGNFQLKIPGEMVSRQIIFSSVGYQSQKLPVATLFEKEFIIIKLIPQTYDIEKIDIEGRSRVLARVLRMASENTPYNYISGPFNLNCSVHIEKTVNDSLPVITRARLLIYDKTGYRAPSKSDAYSMRNYKIEKEQPDYSFSGSILNIDEMLELDWVRNASSVLNPSLTDHFELELTGEPVIDGKSAWLISFRQKKPNLSGSQDFHATAFEGKITILKDDYAVKKIEASVSSERHNRQGKSLAVGNYNSNYYEDVAYNYTIHYSKLIPRSFTMDKSYMFKGQKINEKTNIEITHVQVEEIEEITGRNYFSD